MTFADIESKTNRMGPGDESGGKVRIAVIGTGWIAEHVYLPCLLSHGGIEVAAAHDPLPELLSRFARHAGLDPAYLGLDACFGSEIDGVLLCTPPSVHAQQIAQAVSLNKYVLCEKPVFRNIADLESLGPASRVASRLMGSATMRLRNDVRLLLQWIKDGVLGPLERVRLSWWRERGVPAAGSWRTDPRHSPMGVMEDLGPHLLDLLASLISSQTWKELRVTRAVLRCRYGQDGQRNASWFAGHPHSPYVVPDQAAASLLSDTGTKVEVEVCWANELPGDFCHLWFQGPRGTASFQGLLGLSTLRRVEKQQCSLELAGRPAEIHDFPLGAETQTRAFAESVDTFARFTRNLSPPAADFAEIRRVTEWLTEIQKISGLFGPSWPGEADVEIPGLKEK
ncbi:MAG TPA: Gfo/Idh/MocA family oxidoreductase [Candidatus Angelobacter sp.]